MLSDTIASSKEDQPMSINTRNEFQREADSGRRGLIREVWAFLRCNKKWWLLPILVAMLLAAGLVIVGGTGAAPFIYTLF